MNRETLAELADLNEPASPADIEAAQAALGRVLPPDYVALLRCSDGLEVTVNNDRYGISLFSTGELAEMNQAYEVADYLPDWICIGLDGGGRGIFVRAAAATEEAGRVALSDMGDLQDLKPLGDSIAHWVRQKFDLRDP